MVMLWKSSTTPIAERVPPITPYACCLILLHLIVKPSTRNCDINARLVCVCILNVANEIKPSQLKNCFVLGYEKHHRMPWKKCKIILLR